MSKIDRSDNNNKQNPPLQVGFVYEMRIDKLAIGGSGVGRINNIVVFVPQTAPEETVKVKIIEFKKNHAIAQLIEIVKSSPYRINPPCQYYAECGGCPWQHIEQDQQLVQKQKILEEIFKKFIPNVNYKIPPVIPSSKKFGYRNRIQPHVSEGKIGYYQKKSHNFLSVEKCLIAEEKINSAIPQILSEIGKVKTKPTKIEITLTEDDDVRWHDLNASEDVIGFSQVNQYQNQDLINKLFEWVGNDNYEEIIDLYCGSGNFTYPLFKKFPKADILGVEASSALVKLANKKIPIEKNRLKFLLAPVETFFRRYLPKSEDLLILLDPPRGGCDPYVMRSIGHINFKKLVYVSCHPVSLVRDLERLFFHRAQSQLPPLQILKIQAFEMFPQTDHMEIMVEVGIDS